MTAAPSAGAPGLHREIGLVQAMALVAGGTIGTSIFIIPSAVAQAAGAPAWALAIWVAAGLLALIASLCLAELSSAIPATGGTYAFLGRAYPSRIVPFSFAWMKASIGFVSFGAAGGCTRARGRKLQCLRPALISILCAALATAAAVRGSGAPIFTHCSSVLTSASLSRFFGGIWRSSFL